MNDPYAALGITPDATDEEVTQAYRRLARHYHPDLNPGDKTAEQKMKEVNSAYETIREMRKNGTSASANANGQSRTGSYYGSAGGDYNYGGNRAGQNGQSQNGQGENPFGEWYWSFGGFGNYGQNGQNGQAQNRQQGQTKQPVSLFRLLIRFLIFQAIIMFLMRACMYGAGGGYYNYFGQSTEKPGGSSYTAAAEENPASGGTEAEIHMG